MIEIKFQKFYLFKMLETQEHDTQKRMTKSASFTKQLDQNRQNEKYGGRLYQDSLINKLDPFGDVNSFSYLPRNTFTNSGDMSLKSHIKKQNSAKLNNHSNITLYSERENEDSFQSNSKKMIRKKGTNVKCHDIPASFIMPPILCEETQMNNKSNEKKANSKQEVYESDSELEPTLHHLTNAQLQKKYRNLVQSYINASEQFQALMKKKEKATHALEQLRKNVNELEAEQQIVEEEYERLGLGTPRSKENSNTNANPSMDSVLKADDIDQNKIIQD